MKHLTMLTLLALLAACSSDADRATDYRVFCDSSGRAFVGNPHIGDTYRAPGADEACEIAERVR